MPKRPHRAPPPPAAERTPLTARSWLTGIVALFALLLPLVMSRNGEDSFRLPKELALRAEAIALAAALIVAWAMRRYDLGPLELRSKWLALTALICGWVAVAGIFSTNHILSAFSVARIVALAVVFVVTVLVMRGRPAPFAALILAPAVVNCIAYLLQELDRWPFWENVAGEKHLSRTGFIGNPNDVGSYLIAPAVVAAALALSQRKFRAAWAAAALLIAATTFVTQTVAAMGALVVALVVMAGLWLRSWPKFGAALLAIAVAAAIAVSLYSPLRERVVVMRQALAHRDYETLSASRTVPFLAAASMAADHPLFGVGPGCFSYNYLGYKIRLQQRHRWIFGPNKALDNFGETHNDHLQTMAETGFPGYALLLAALVLLGSGSLPRAAGGNEYVRLAALPLAAGFFVLALAQFPLEIAAPAHAFLWAAASVAAWRQW